MSYPDARYLADTGEISAVFRSAEQAPGPYRWDAHFHKTISEAFFIISGAMRLFNGEQWIDATEGDFLYVPEGGVHGFRNESGAPASMLILSSPGAPREAYFEGLAEIGQLSDEERIEFFIRHDTYWT